MLLSQASQLYRNLAARREEGVALATMGRLYLGIGQPDSGLVLLRMALPLLRTSADRVEEGRTLSNIGGALGNLGQLDSALVYFEMALPLLADQPVLRAGTLVSIGIVMDRTGRPDSGLAAFRLALPLLHALNDSTREAVALLGIGNILATLGSPDSALFYAHRALALQRGTNNAAAQGQTLKIIAAILAETGLPDSARAYLQQAVLLSRAGKDIAGEAGTLHNLGILFARVGAFDSAVAYYRQALPLRRATGDRSSEGMTLDAIASVLADLGQPDSALAYYRNALPLRGSRPAEAGTLQNIGTVFQDLGAPDSALVYYRLALAIQRIVRDADSEALTLGAIGVAFNRLSRSDSALAYHRAALTIQRERRNRFREAGSLHNIASVFGRMGRHDSALAYERLSLPIRQELGDVAGESRTLHGIGLAFARAGLLDSAVDYLDRATSRSLAVSSNAGGDFSRVSYNETISDYYDLWTLAWLARAPRLKSGAGVDSNTAAYAALGASERGRSRALLDLMRDSTIRIQPGMDVRAEGARLVAGLREAHSAGLVYWITSDTLLIWIITKSRVDVYRQPIGRDDLGSLVRRFREGLGIVEEGARLSVRGEALERDVPRSAGVATGAPKGTPSSLSLSRDRLTAILLPPKVRRQISREPEVVIVPHGVLALVPFAALQVGPTRTPFGAAVAVRYAPSLTTLQQIEATGIPGARERVAMDPLIVGNPSMPVVEMSTGNPSRLTPLPGAEAESRAVAIQLGVAPLTGAAATEAQVVQRLPSAGLVHLATHGFAYSSAGKARSSFVALASDSLHDGLLTVGKLLDDAKLKLVAELVVLSACQTGLGNLSQTEGTVGLQRAFLAKGARSVLVSLWNVSDAATERLMIGYYRHWLGDMDHPSKAESLRRSQEELRRLAGFAHPRYWAGFQLVGAR